MPPFNPVHRLVNGKPSYHIHSPSANMVPQAKQILKILTELGLMVKMTFETLIGTAMFLFSLIWIKSLEYEKHFIAELKAGIR